MRTFSYLTLPLLAAALLYANTSDALFDGLKNTITRSFVCTAGLFNTNNNTPNNTTKPIKPFVSGKEKKATFRKLIALESGMAGIIDYEDFGITQAIYDIELSRHRETLMLFFQQLFRSIVKKDIKNQEVYTVLLGLNVTEDNSLTMEQLPVTVTEGCTTNVYIQAYGGLDMLSRLIDICDEKIKPTLKDIRNIEILKQHVYKKRPNPTKNADSFFPKITVINGMEMARRDKELPAGYFQINGNEIVIDENYFSATNCRTMIHEFAHRLQWPWLECGVTNCVPFWNWDLCFNNTVDII